MADETSGNVLDVTLRDFTAGQKVFNRYTLLRILGRGGMGIVWLAQDDVLERQVALKFVPDIVVFDPGVLSDLRRETKRSLELTHENIVRIYDFAQDEKSACISMEYIDGGTLSSLRVQKENKIFETDEIAGWIAQVCDALDYAHNHARIVHRDLKPSNLMVNQRGEIKVTDFGIARSLSDSVSMLTMQRGTSGTLVYMSPQQLDGLRATHLDDIYSVGATIYELLTSKPPFHSGGIEKQIHERVPPSVAARREELEAKSDTAVSSHWEETIAACLSKDPAQRPQSAAEIAKRLSDPNFRPEPPPRKTEAVSKPSRKVAPVAVVVGIMVLLGAAAGWYFGSYVPSKKSAQAEEERSKAAEHQAKGSALIRTEPSGAVVTLGNQIQKSPATFNDMKVGNVPMRIELDGYESVERQIEIKGNEIADSGIIRLERSKGDAEIRSYPDGVEFDLVDADGNHHSGKTPQTLSELPTGAAKIAFKRPGTNDHTEQLQVLSNKTASGTFTLTMPMQAPIPSAPATAAVEPLPTASAKPSPSAKPTKLFAGTWTGKMRGTTKTTIDGKSQPASSGSQTWDKPMTITIDESEKTFRMAGGDYGTVSVKGNKATLQLDKKRIPTLTKGQHRESAVTMTLQEDAQTASYDHFIKMSQPHERTGAPVVVRAEMVGTLHKEK